MTKMDRFFMILGGIGLAIIIKLFLGFYDSL